MGYYNIANNHSSNDYEWWNSARRLVVSEEWSLILRHHPTPCFRARFSSLFGIKSTMFVGSRALASCLRPRSASSISSTMSVSAEEVAKHNTDKDCWVIVGDQVLDVTNFLSRSDSDQLLLQLHLFFTSCRQDSFVSQQSICQRIPQAVCGIASFILDAGASYFFFAMCFIWDIWAVFESLRDENRQGIDGNSTERKEAGLLRPTKSRVGSNIAVLGLKLGQTGAHLGPTWAQLAPNSGPNLTPTGVQYGATWARLNLVMCGGIWRRSWAQGTPNVGNMASHEPIKAKKRWK